jgi:hypothetical protein
VTISPRKNIKTALVHGRAMRTPTQNRGFRTGLIKIHQHTRLPHEKIKKKEKEEHQP